MKNIRTAFFTEAGRSRGMGHFIRTRTIYESFKENGAHVTFFLDSDLDFNYKFQDIIPFSWNDFEIDNFYDVIIIDSYIASKKIYNIASLKSKLIVSLDDYCRIDYPKGMIVNFSPDSNKLFYNEKKEGYNYLLGLDYVPIRKEFKDIRIEKKNHIFIMIGGSDVNNLTEIVLNSIKNEQIPKVVVVNNKKNLKQIEKYTNTKILYKPNDKDLISAMSSSSLAISTASMTLYELSFFNIPTIIIAIAHNQKIGATQSINHNLAVSLLDIEKNNWENEIKQLIKNAMLKNNFYNKKKIDGNGAQRIFNNVKKVLGK